MNCARIVQYARKLGKMLGAEITDHDLPFTVSVKKDRVEIACRAEMPMDDFEREWLDAVQGAYPSKPVRVEYAPQDGEEDCSAITYHPPVENPKQERLPHAPAKNPQQIEMERRIAGQSEVSGRINGSADEVAAGLRASLQDGLRQQDYWAAEINSAGINMDVSFTRSFFLQETGASKFWYGTGDPDCWRDSASGELTRAFFLEDQDGTQLLLQMKEDGGEIYLSHIFKAKGRQGNIGYRFMQALKKYADLKGRRVQIIKVANQEYFSRFPWLTFKDGGMLFEYDARG